MLNYSFKLFLFLTLYLAAPKPQFENSSHRLIITNPMKLYTADWRSSSALFHRPTRTLPFLSVNQSP